MTLHTRCVVASPDPSVGGPSAGQALSARASCPHLPDLCLGIVSGHLDFPLNVLFCLKPRHARGFLSFPSAGTEPAAGCSDAH